MLLQGHTLLLKAERERMRNAHTLTPQQAARYLAFYSIFIQCVILDLFT